ncbi:hypothetical protein R1sor_009932 [Riccia sorocarpa]|uniref:Protein kinase domain-containing protein n=1 Tax=Riccia sorocarpa TaxID=122646 RepID=A0ABD3HY86_9MARC
MPTWEDERSLVFAALGDLGMAQQVHIAASVNDRKYPRVPKKERDWIAPELVDSKIEKLAARNIHIRPVYEYNKATDVYALGVLTHQVCGDFFTDMTMLERNAYNKKYYALGAPKDTDPPGRNEILLKDLIQSATHHHAHMRTSAAQCFELMSDTMKINPMTCSRPTETPSQQRRERTNVYEDYLNAERFTMADHTRAADHNRAKLLRLYTTEIPKLKKMLKESEDMLVQRDNSRQSHDERVQELVLENAKLQERLDAT